MTARKADCALRSLYQQQQLTGRPLWRASHFPDCGPHRVPARKGRDQWRGSIRNLHLSFASKRRS
jgi:hypothetical protein